jgi:hypothetical protein
MKSIMRVIAIAGLDRARGVYAAVFIAAFLSRLAVVQRGEFTPWWDGIGWGYADLWIGGATALAFEGSPAGLHFATEGLVYVPLLALVFKLFGLSTGMEVWSFVLIAVAASVALMATATVHLITGRIAGGVVAGAFVIFDPVLEWFGLNGWSDAFTFLGVATTFLIFFACARRPTRVRLVLLGVSLAFLALGHATWTWPALAWAILAWPLLANRQWFDRAEPVGDSRGNSLRFAIPLVAFLVCMLAVNWYLVGAGLADEGNLAPVFSSDVNNQRSLITRLDPDVEWATWEPADTIRTFVFKVPGLFPSLFSDLVGQQITGAIPLSAWLLLVMGVAVLVLALAQGRPRLSGWAVLGPALFAVLALALNPVENAAVVILLAVLAAAWVYMQVARAILAIVAPLALILVVFLPVITQFRHSNAVIFALLIIAGAAIDGALARWSIYRPGEGRDGALIARLATLATATTLVIVVVVGALQAVTAAQFRLGEERYLTWLGAVMGPGDALLTSGDVNPWRVQELIGRPIAYDVENGGRLLVTGTNSEWGRRVAEVTAAPATTGDVLRVLAGDGRLWFYRPGETVDVKRFAPRLAGENQALSFLSLIPVATYPADDSRAALAVGDPIEILEEPPSVPSQTGRG